MCRSLREGRRGEIAIDSPPRDSYLDPVLRWFLKVSVLGESLVLASLLLLTGVLTAGEMPSAAGPEAVRARWVMGTVLEVRLPAATRDVGLLAEAAFAEASKVEAAASLWRPGTELAAVHARAAAGESVVLSETLGDLVGEALRAAELTEAAFSPAVGALVESYDLRGKGRWPSGAEIRRAVALARPDGVRYDPASRTLRLEPGVRLDFDGIAKGFALDRAAAVLRSCGVEDALLNFGGQLLVLGPPRGAPARVALVGSPFDRGASVLSIPIRDGSLSTSADTERLRLVAGREAGHLLDPRTGNLVRLRGSVSVLAPSGAMADALSTAWAAEGPEAFRRSDPGSPLRRAGALAFVLAGRDGACETLTDLPFERLGPPGRGTDAVVSGP